MPDRRYTFRRYVSTVDRMLVPVEALSDSSVNVEFNTRKGSFRRRLGHAILGDTWGGTPAGPVSGLLESAWGAIPRQIKQIVSPSLDDGYPTYAVLFTDPTANEGAIYVRSTGTNGGGANNYVLGAEYGATHYTPDSNGTGNFHVIPLRSFNSTDKLTRLNSAPLRKLVGAGGRRGLLEKGNWLFFQGDTPGMWNKEWNDATGSGSNVNRVRPWGNPVPLIMPDSPEDSYPAESQEDTGWACGSTHYRSVMFKFEDGSYSKPMIPREPNTLNPLGLGKVTIPGTVGYRRTFVPWENIPIGPKGVVERILLRTVQTAAVPDFVPAVSRLFICGIVGDNTSTTYDDYLSNDIGLIDDPELVRPVDHMWPWRARCVAANDGRVLIGGALKPNPAAIILAPTGVNTSRELNLDEDNTSLGANDRFAVQVVTGGILRLKYIDTLGHTENTKSIGITGTVTIQDVVDQINKLTVNDTCKEWVAQVAPGTDPQTLAGYLLPTDTEDVGDDSITDITGAGNVRAFCPSFPAVLYFNDIWDALYTANDQEIHFTGASPGHPQGAVMNFYTKNQRSPRSLDDGRFVGAAPLGNMFVVCYANAIYLLRNQRDGTTGRDEDYRLFPLNSNRGCIAWDSIVAGDGWVAYLTREGYVVTDGVREDIISGDVFDANGSLSGPTGDWVDEVAACAASTAADADDEQFHAMISDGRLWVSYRGVGDDVPSEKMVYDFSAHHRASGIDEVMGPDGAPLGWSPPHSAMAPGPMGWVEKSDGRWLLAAHVVNTGTNDGGVVRFNTGNLDFTSAITLNAFGPLDQFDTIRRVQVQHFWLVYTKNGTGHTFRFFRDIPLADVHAITLVTSSTSLFKRQKIELPLGARGNAEAALWEVRDIGTSANPLEVFALIANYNETLCEV